MMDKFLKNKNEPQVNPLSKVFYDLESIDESPFRMAMASYNALKQEAKSSEELFYYLIEDAMFTSLYATFYEQLLVTIGQNPDFTLDLIEKFSDDGDERERLIAGQAQDHLSFIENFGMCDGCKCCENHTDVAELIAPFQKGDIDFFTELYIGMQTIQFSMEYLIFEVIPNDVEIAKSFSPKNIMDWRQTIYSYAQLKASEV
ncbi:MAG: hypothetical protein BM556_01010 [Bacteriovorax sp. MedPE-SWde]|nr:MAG: hypothetical protein BM556_01010 [Bacteriovorax sp. MedPE-SWde]